MEGENTPDDVSPGGCGKVEPRLSEPRSATSKMERKERKRKSLPSDEAEVGEFDEDERPIGSLFNFKKIKVAKKRKPPSVRVGAENPRCDEQIHMGGMDDTLASFRKKLKAPKKGKGATGGLVSEGSKDSLSLDSANLDKMEDIFSRRGQPGTSGSHGRRGYQRALTGKDDAKGVPPVHDNNFSDGRMGDSLSTFVKSVHPAKKAKGTGGTSCTDAEMKFKMDMVSTDVLLSSPSMKHSLSSDGSHGKVIKRKSRLSLTSDGSREKVFKRKSRLSLTSDGSKEKVIKRRNRRKSEYCTLPDLKIDNLSKEHLCRNSDAGMSVIEQPASLRKTMTGSSLLEEDMVPTPMASDVLDSASALKQPLCCLTQEASFVSVLAIEGSAHFDCYGGSDGHFEEPLDDSAPSVLQVQTPYQTFYEKLPDQVNEKIATKEANVKHPVCLSNSVDVSSEGCNGVMAVQCQYTTEFLSNNKLSEKVEGPNTSPDKGIPKAPEGICSLRKPKKEFMKPLLNERYFHPCTGNLTRDEMPKSNSGRILGRSFYHDDKTPSQIEITNVINSEGHNELLCPQVSLRGQRQELQLEFHKTCGIGGDHNEHLSCSCFSHAGVNAEETHSSIAHPNHSAYHNATSCSSQCLPARMPVADDLEPDNVIHQAFSEGVSLVNPILHNAPKEPSSVTNKVPTTKKDPDAVNFDARLDQRETHQNELLENNQSTISYAKMHRLGDMACEGDVDWEILMHEQGFYTGISTADENQSSRPKAKSCFSVDATNSDSVAVAAGLKPHAVNHIEKIKFRDVFKRRGGLQEYLDCRNFILGCWSKDVKHILPRTSCGITDVPSKDEPPHQTLIREIYMFLDRNGYINAGVASEQGIVKLGSLSYHRDPQRLQDKGDHMVNAAGLDKITRNFFQANLLEHTTAMLNNNLTEVQQNMKLVAGNDEGESLLPSCGRLEHSRNVQVNGQTKIEQDVVPAVTACDAECFTTSMIGNLGCWDSESNLTIAVDNFTSHDEGTRQSDAHQEDNAETCKAPIACQQIDTIDCGPIVDVSSKHALAFSDTDSIKEMESGHANVHLASVQPLGADNHTKSDPNVQKKIIIVGAGPSGITAARHLHRQGFCVTVLEARDRLGGRIYTDRSSLSVPVDLGASIITGVEADVATERRPDPSSLVCSQLGLELTVLNSDCPLYDIVTGDKVPSDLDEALETEYNSLLDDMELLVAQHGESAMNMSLEDGLEYAIRYRRMSKATSDIVTEFDIPNLVNNPIKVAATVNSSSCRSTDCVDNELKTNVLSPLERRVMNWHFAHLEYGCAAPLTDVSLPHWNQDDVYGGFGGPHCMIKGGYSTVVESLGMGLDIQLNQNVTEIIYDINETGGALQDEKQVKVITSSGKEFVGDAVLITVPLGCLKAETIKFSPTLPDWKQASIRRLGFGVLNKVILEFPTVFWDDNVDYFGATAEETNQRGQCFMFWNVKKTVGAPVLIALVVGKSAKNGQTFDNSDHVGHALLVLRKLFSEAAVPDPVASVVTNWGMDPFSRGAYSYVAIGASGEDYDTLGRPVANCLFFAGEATCKEHPDTVGGAMMSGLREAVRIMDILTTGKDHLAEVEWMEAIQKQSDSQRNEVKDLSKQLDAYKLGALSKSSSDGKQSLPTKDSVLQDLFFSAKTTSGRLHLAKELLRLPVESLKSFAGTREGLGTLNTWILDSLGKNSTQLLRHCVRLLVLVSTDLVAVRLSGIGRTIKEKVCVHTSRDIRSVASQLVKMWVEVFRKEKAVNGLKLLRQATGLELSKVRSKDGKSHLRASTETSETRCNLQVRSSSGSHSPSKANNRKTEVAATKLESSMSLKSDVKSLHFQRMAAAKNSLVISEEEAATFAAIESARAAALKAAKAYATSEAEVTTMRELPKIPSFHKFARREHCLQIDELDVRRRQSDGNFIRQDCASEIDSRNCRVRDWSVDFSVACGNMDNSKLSGDNHTHSSYSNELAYASNAREHSGESVAIDSRMTRAWVDTDRAGSGGVKDSVAIERWQSQAMDADADFYSSIHMRDEEESNKEVLPDVQNQCHSDEVAAIQFEENKSLFENQVRGVHHIKQGVVDFVASLLMPLYRTRKIDREGYKSIMKKAATKVMEQCTEREKNMAVYDFLDFRRKNKIRSFVDKLIERHLTMQQGVKL
ncbi:lysine-specific histone demethylase 1 homolog 3-like isoform X1 [Zingiber officinale]|uniref:lysine-specific histone demethylase 1 homolog 3-like isoform X1 n=1 Tax=Zingiber officinale TaxID=94328 RepID=UPI001C4B4C5A|nr:lysine-specific histone demethylase 1 homolog 3-like isoform X1 [Zingiber officinale]